MTNETAFRKKVLAMRKEVVSLDWKPDKTVLIAKTGNKYDYISIAKIKSNFAPLLEKCGLDLDMDVDFEHMKILESLKGETHVILPVTWTLIDVDTGYAHSETVLGESSDMGDKAVVKAQTYSLKSWLSCKFLLAEGDLPDVSEQEVSSSKQFVRKTPEQEAEVKSKIIEAGVPPKADAKPAEKAPAKKEKPVAAKPKEEPKEEPKEAPKAEAKDAPKFKPMPAQAKAIENITKRWEAKAKSGDVSVERYNQMSADCATISSAAEAVEFIKKYKEI